MQYQSEQPHDFLTEATISVRNFLQESQKGPIQTNQNTQNIDHLQNIVNSLAQETRAKAKEYEKLNKSQHKSQTNRTPSKHRRSGSKVRLEKDCELIKKWSNPSVQSSRLLTGGSATFKHVPGAQYCIDAGIHHHHAHSVAKKPAMSIDMSWFADMETRLKSLAHELEKERNSCCSDDDDKAGQLYQIRFAVLSKHLEEMNALQQEKLRQDQERMRLSEKEWEQRARELAELYAKMLQDDRDQWRSVIQNLQQTYLQDLDELRRHYEHLMGEDRARMQEEIDRLSRLLADAHANPPPPVTVPVVDHALVDELRREVARLQDLLAAKDSSRLRIHVREGVAKPVTRTRFNPTSAGESVWASGPVNKARLGQKNPFPDAQAPEVTPAVVRVRGARGEEVDPNKYQFVLEE